MRYYLAYLFQLLVLTVAAAVALAIAAAIGGAVVGLAALVLYLPLILPAAMAYGVHTLLTAAGLWSNLPLLTVAFALVVGSLVPWQKVMKAA